MPSAQLKESASAHWDDVYARKRETDVSWYEEEPRQSLELIREALKGSPGRVIDVGGGASVLIDRLLERGYPSPAVLDISDEALARSRARLGPAARNATWLVADITGAEDVGTYDVWHDRAVFHFLTEEAERRSYLSLARRSVAPLGHLIVATFGPGGPERCSGLPVGRYDGAALGDAFSPYFRPLRLLETTHLTPWGETQPFTYGLFERTS